MPSKKRKTSKVSSTSFSSSSSSSSPPSANKRVKHPANNPSSNSRSSMISGSSSSSSSSNNNNNNSNSSSKNNTKSHVSSSGSDSGPSHRASPRSEKKRKPSSIAAQLSKTASLAFYDAYHSPTIFYRLMQSRANKHGPLFLPRTLSYRYTTRNNIRGKTTIDVLDESNTHKSKVPDLVQEQKRMLKRVLHESGARTDPIFLNISIKGFVDHAKSRKSKKSGFQSIAMGGGRVLPVTLSVYEENDSVEGSTTFYTLIESHALLVNTSSGTYVFLVVVMFLCLLLF
jgi:hypothetical protein